jgi:1-acyl-sn-glycerol-3-phosphate acyltransferase
VYLFVGLYILLLGPWALAWSFAAGDNRLLYALARFCIRAAGWMCGVRVRLRGREKIQPGVTYVFLANHQGNMDGPVLFHAVPRDWKALIKHEMMRVPILSVILKRADFVPLERSNPQKARAGIEQGAKLLGQGHSLIAFPEGTRSRDGRLGDFKKGVFIMAIKAQVPIMPVTILGSDRVQPPGKYSIRPATVRVVFHDPIPTANCGPEDRDRLMELTRSAIESGLRSAQ